MIAFLQFALVAYLAVGGYSCWWGIKSTREMNITDEDYLMLLAILSLSAITLWPLFFIMEDVKFDNPFTAMCGRYIKAFQEARNSFKQAAKG
jgi:cation transport ATPase